MSDRDTPAWVGWTYVAYCTAIVGITWFWAGYAVFVAGYSGWWFLLALPSGFCYSPWRWYAICDGIERPFDRFKVKQ